MVQLALLSSSKTKCPENDKFTYCLWHVRKYPCFNSIFNVEAKLQASEKNILFTQSKLQLLSYLC